MPELVSDSNTLENLIKNTTIAIVHFAAEWVEQCLQVDDLLDTLAKQSEYSKVKFYKCQAEELPDLSLKNKIEAVPTIIIFQSGKAIDRVNGADAAKITATIKHRCSDSTISNNTSTNKDFSLDIRLKELINKHKVMLFMKGDRNTPRCGFSKQIIQLLNETGSEYETFDILSDEEVRQGLKTYSDWPTYPQLYVKGELIGGLDIVKEMQVEGELKSTLDE